MLIVTGGGVKSEADLWKKIRSQLGLPSSSSTGHATAITGKIGTEVKGSIGVPGLFSGGASGTAGGEVSGTRDSTDNFEELAGVDLLQAVRASGKTLVLDDFHYIDRAVQTSLVEQFKEAARANCTIVIVAVAHRLDDAIRANPDLRGRVTSIEVPYWSPEELRQIPLLGFPQLRMEVPSETINRLVEESLSSPQLIQSLCLEFCRFVGVDDELLQSKIFLVDPDKLVHVFQRVANTSSSHTALTLLKNGPRVRGTERNLYTLTDGSTGDVYTVVLRAMAHGKPKLALSYTEIRDRVAEITRGYPPSGSSITSTLAKMDETAEKMANEDRILEWDQEKETLNFSDPYFLYFLRWRT
jgi:hypothetical protein